mmetsp:Transcript_20241/g.56151  ORF Transcript_20241/g.56151 Transcript_20241/m.56151 type:complete len:236 (+) Transcript_20241:2090-2797(+)
MRDREPLPLQRWFMRGHDSSPILRGATSFGYGAASCSVGLGCLGPKRGRARRLWSFAHAAAAGQRCSARRRGGAKHARDTPAEELGRFHGVRPSVLAPSARQHHAVHEQGADLSRVATLPHHSFSDRLPHMRQPHVPGDSDTADVALCGPHEQAPRPRYPCLPVAAAIHQEPRFQAGGYGDAGGNWSPLVGRFEEAADGASDLEAWWQSRCGGGCISHGATHRRLATVGCTNCRT